MALGDVMCPIFNHHLTGHNTSQLIPGNDNHVGTYANTVITQNHS